MSSEFYAVALNKMKPISAGNPHMNTTPVMVTIWLIKSTRKKRGKFSKTSDNADLALSK